LAGVALMVIPHEPNNPKSVPHTDEGNIETGEH